MNTACPSEAADLDLILGSPLFDAVWYERHFPDVAFSGLSPEQHYLRYGGPLGRPASRRFSDRSHPDLYERAASQRANPLIQFLRADG